MTLKNSSRPSEFSTKSWTFCKQLPYFLLCLSYIFSELLSYIDTTQIFMGSESIGDGKVYDYKCECCDEENDAVRYCRDCDKIFCNAVFNVCTSPASIHMFNLPQSLRKIIKHPIISHYEQPSAIFNVILFRLLANTECIRFLHWLLFSWACARTLRPCVCKFYR